MNWECNNCGKVHKGNPNKCSSCSHTILSPTYDSPTTVSQEIDVKYIMAGLLILTLVLIFGIYVL